MNYQEMKPMIDFFCLQNGLIQYSVTYSEKRGSIDEALHSLDPEESRKCRRKFRKLLRKNVKYKAKRDVMKKSRKRNIVMNEMYAQTFDTIYNGLGDNDEA